MIGFSQFLARFGGLHDCGVTRIDWRIEDKRFEIEIDDIWTNFEGMPEYRGPRACRITLEGVTSIQMRIDDVRGRLKIYEISVSTEIEQAPKLSATFWPSGSIEIIFGAVVCPQVE